MSIVPAFIVSPQTVLHTPKTRLYPIVQFWQLEVETGQDIQYGSIQGTTSQRLVVALYIYPIAHELQIRFSNYKSIICKIKYRIVLK